MQKLLNSLAVVIAAFLLTTQITFAQLSLTPAHYQQLNLLQTSFASTETEELAEAESLALKIIKEVKGTTEQQAFVRSFTARLLAQHLMQTQRLDAAIELLEKRFIEDAAYLETQQQQDFNWQLIHLLTQAAQYQKALELLKNWWEQEEIPSAEANYLRSALLAQLEQWKEAKGYILTALDNKQPEAWLSLGVAIMQKLEDWEKAAELQQKRVYLNPEKGSYWLALAQLQLLANQNQAALVTLKLAHQQKYLPTKQIESLGLRLLNKKQSLLAAQVFEQLLEEEPKDIRLNKLAAQAWLNTKDKQKTTFALERLAKRDNTSRNLGQLGQWYFNLGQWQQAANKLQQAIEVEEKKLAKIEKTENEKNKKYLNQLRLSLAQSYIELNLTEEAKTQLNLLTGAQFKTQANQWLNYLQATNKAS